MIKTIKISLASLFICVLFVSCKAGIKKEAIAACESENESYRKYEEQMIVKHEELSTKYLNMEKDFISGLDQKKKLYEKDKELIKNILRKKEILNGLADKYLALSDSIKMATDRNDKFIATLSTGIVSVEEADSTWSSKKQKINDYQNSGESCIAKIDNKESELLGLYREALKKYGKNLKQTSNKKR